MDGVCRIEGTIAFFAVGLCLGEFLYGETSHALLTFQGILYVNVLSVCFVAVLILRLGFVLGNDGFHSGIKLIDAVLHVRLCITKELQPYKDVGGDACVCLEVADMVVNHGGFNVNPNLNPNENENLLFDALTC